MKTRRAARSPFVETLENRQLLSAVVDVRLTGGGQSVVADHVGQVVNFDVFVTVTGNNGSGSDEGLQILVGSMLSSNITGGAAAGNITLNRVAPFNGPGSSNGTQADVDGDGDLDVGSNNDIDATPLFVARDAGMNTSGTVSGASNTFKVATGSFTVSSLLTGVQTNLTFRPRAANPNWTSALWQEDGVTVPFKNANNGTLAAGASITLKRSGAASINGRVFNDKNATGFFDGDDTGIDGFRVFLDSNFNGVLDTGEVSKPVSSTGTYHFTGIDAGTYRVREVFRQGWRQSFPALGYYEITLKYGETAKTQSFANTDTVVIKGKVWNDTNKDGAINNGEGGIPGWTVYLDLNHDGILDTGDKSTTTDTAGNYRFFQLPAGTYVVRALPVATWRPTVPGSGAKTVTLTAGGTASNKNFGEKRFK
jgi:SdrD B-like domain